MKFRSIVVSVCCALIVQLPVGRSAFAAGNTPLAVPEELTTATHGSEYVSGDRPGVVLMPVNLWGAVEKPGVHYVPTQTDLFRLLSFGGGPTKDAEMEEVTIKRFTPSGDQITQVNLQKLIEKPGGLQPALEPNDIVFIPSKSEGISPNTMKAITVVSLILGVVVSSIVISKSANF